MKLNYTDLVNRQRKFFLTNQTKSIDFRVAQLRKLKAILHQEESALYAAIYKDFKKSMFETYGSELSFIYHDIDTSIKKIHRWSKPKRIKTNLVNFPARSYVMPEPLGVCLVIGAWNYPYMLSLLPLVPAIAAGNTAIIKPSEFPKETSAVIARIINSNFPTEYLHVVEGSVPETTALLEQKFDKIFFTGSTKVGKIVYEAAAKHLTPVTLELGGKSPAFVTRNSNLKEAARRISWGKFLSAGQSCVAPDYVFVDEKVKDDLLALLKDFTIQYNHSVDNENYVQIINDRNFDRLSILLKNQHVFYGGKLNQAERTIEPTILVDTSFDDPIMQEEIFGPILPVLTYTDLQAAIDKVKEGPKPLAAYFFTNDPKEKEKFLSELSFGGGAINDTMMHISNPHLPYGGVGESGMGAYHDEAGFKSFSHFKGILEKPLWFETNLKYPPYTDRKFRLLKWLLSR